MKIPLIRHRKKGHTYADNDATHLVVGRVIMTLLCVLLIVAAVADRWHIHGFFRPL